jgi:hydroxymethylglutaryl-CoA synthase
VELTHRYHGNGTLKQAEIVMLDEDPVTLAAGAVSRLLQVADVRPSDIGMLIVGSESGVDASKPIAAYVHGLLGLPNACRTFDTQHACYGATAGLQLAAAWATRSPDRKAVVVASDIARYDVGSAGEPTQGAGAVAMLVSSAYPL